jgi:MoxR-like ATPase
VGGMVYSPGSGQFTFRPGPVFCNILLADEINRASPRTQSALLEAMNERQVTTEGRTHVLADPFIVIATENPIEHHGTYPLPEAQLDRFAMQIEMGYPNEAEEMEIVLQQRQHHPLEDVKAVAETADILAVQERVRQIDVEESIVRYMTEVVRSTRHDSRLKLGASPRAALILYRTSQALAMLRGRSFVIPDDIKELAVPVLAHRLALEAKSHFSGISKPAVVQDILNAVAVPV